jgi:transposase
MNRSNKKTNSKNSSNSQALKSPAPAASKAKTIKLGIDVHLDLFVVTRIIDGSTPQPAQRFKPQDFLLWCAKQLTLAEQVFSCYEAGPFGYTLHRTLEKMGISNYVVRPRDWDEYGQKVKTDKRDATALADCLDRHVSGNRRALGVVRVPTEAEEQKRSLARQRESLQKEKQRLAAQGRSHALYYGHHLQGEWWRDGLWERRVLPLSSIVVNLLEPLRRLIRAVEIELTARTRQVEAAAPAGRPVGLGKLTSAIVEREVADWGRFHNRRQVSSYTGLCPSEDTSSDRRFQGPINKHGNRRLRPVLIECAWRLAVFQPGYRAVQKWRPVLADPQAGKPRRKKAIVALARTFAVDWWRVRTGRCQAEDLGLRLKPVTAATPAAGPEEDQDNPFPQ